jgi:hypothetical protein
MSSSEDYSLNFRRMKEGEEKMPLNMADLEWEEYNEPYKMEELEYALQNCNGSSPGLLKASERVQPGLGRAFFSGRMDWGPSGPGLAAWKRQE